MDRQNRKTLGNVVSSGPSNSKACPTTWWIPFTSIWAGKPAPFGHVCVARDYQEGLGYFLGLQVQFQKNKCPVHNGDVPNSYICQGCFGLHPALSSSSASPSTASNSLGGELLGMVITWHATDNSTPMLSFNFSWKSALCKPVQKIINKHT